MAKPKKLTLEQRIEALHEEIDSVIAKHFDKIAASCPGVPRGVIEQTVIGRAHGCRCEAFKIINEKN
jgi:hypothetical protein